MTKNKNTKVKVVTETKIVPIVSSLPKGVTLERGMYRARDVKTRTHLGYFKDQESATRAVNISGVSVDNSRTKNKFRAKLGNKHLGYFKTRTAAVKAVLAATA